MPERRRFLKALAIAPLAPAALVSAEGPPATPSPTPAPPVPSPSPSPAAPSAAARALADVVRARYAAHGFTEEEMAEIERGIDGNLRAGERLKRLGLKNGDEPVTTFAARPPRPRSQAAAPRRSPR